MEKNNALNLAIDALRHIIKEKRKTHFFPPEREKMEEKLKIYDEAINKLEELKDKELEK